MGIERRENRISSLSDESLTRHFCNSYFDPETTDPAATIREEGARMSIVFGVWKAVSRANVGNKSVPIEVINPDFSLESVRRVAGGLKNAERDRLPSFVYGTRGYELHKELGDYWERIEMVADDAIEVERITRESS